MNIQQPRKSPRPYPSKVRMELTYQGTWRVCERATTKHGFQFGEPLTIYGEHPEKPKAKGLLDLIKLSR